MAFLGITVPTEVARILSKIDLPGTKEPQLEYHITMFYFGEDLPIENILKIIQCLHKTITKKKIFRVSTKQVTCFPKNKETDEAAIIAKIISKELIEIRKTIATVLDKEKIEYSKKFEFSPHITLSYSKEEIKSKKIDEVEFTVDKLSLWAGDKDNQNMTVDFFLDPEKKKVANIIQQVNLFCKITDDII